MDKDETKKLMTLLTAAYPRVYGAMTEAQKREQLSLWHDMFEEYPGAIVAQACKNYIRVNEYPPTVAGLQKQIELIIPQSTAADAFTALQKACRNCLYNAAEEFAKLPQSVQRWVGDPAALKELALLEPDELATVVRGEFLKSYPEVQKRAEVQRTLPAAVIAEIEGQKILELPYEQEYTEC